jgi:putative flavoprotein involved in K+ transport
MFFIGLPWQHTRGSALIGFVKDDAAFIARCIESNLEHVAAVAGAHRDET